jgi:hypothetical protein
VKKPTTFKRVLYSPTPGVQGVLYAGAALIGLGFAASVKIDTVGATLTNLAFTFVLWSVFGYVILYAIAAAIQRNRTKTVTVVVQKKRKR